VLRNESVKILLEVDRERGLPAIIALLNSPEDSTWDTVVDTLIRLEPPPVQECLAACQSDDPRIITGALNVLASKASLDEFPLFEPLSHHENEEIIEIASWAIELIEKRIPKSHR
jgi:hypothetical protein